MASNNFKSNYNRSSKLDDRDNIEVNQESNENYNDVSIIENNVGDFSDRITNMKNSIEMSHL